MSAEKPSVTTESSDIVTSTITSVVLLFDCLKRTFLTVAVTYFSQRDTECYSSGKSAFRDNTSVLLILTCKRFSPVLNVAQANEIESAPALSNVAQRDTECYLVHSVLTLPVVPYCNLMPSAFEMVT